MYPNPNEPFDGYYSRDLHGGYPSEAERLAARKNQAIDAAEFAVAVWSIYQLWRYGGRIAHGFIAVVAGFFVAVLLAAVFAPSIAEHAFTVYASWGVCAAGCFWALRVSQARVNANANV
jgi:hypothetical protein